MTYGKTQVLGRSHRATGKQCDMMVTKSDDKGIGHDTTMCGDPKNWGGARLRGITEIRIDGGTDLRIQGLTELRSNGDAELGIDGNTNLQINGSNTIY